MDYPQEHIKPYGNDGKKSEHADCKAPPFWKQIVLCKTKSVINCNADSLTLYKYYRQIYNAVQRRKSSEISVITSLNNLSA